MKNQNIRRKTFLYVYALFCKKIEKKPVITTDFSFLTTEIHHDFFIITGLEGSMAALSSKNFGIIIDARPDLLVLWNSHEQRLDQTTNVPSFILQSGDWVILENSRISAKIDPIFDTKVKDGRILVSCLFVLMF